MIQPVYFADRNGVNVIAEAREETHLLDRYRKGLEDWYDAKPARVEVGPH